jgi:hypothetical protein
MKDQAPETFNGIIANDSAIWMQKDAVNLKGASDAPKPNPFVQAQSALPQMQSSANQPTGTQQKKP